VAPVPLRARLAIFLAATFVVAAAFAVTVGSGGDEPARAAAPEGALRPPGIPPAEFRLRDQDDRLATLREYRGQVVVVTFLYTTCEDTCPLVAQQIRGAMDRLGHDVPALAIAVDPPRDTAERARSFLARQRITGRIRFLVGPAGELRRQWEAYGIRRQTAELEHSGHVVLLDRRGVQRIGFPPDRVTPEGLAHDIALLEAEPAA
jgi:protein SCO1